MNSQLSHPVRFSIIDYLNALPLNMAFKDGLFGERARVIFDYPSQCADNLATSQADVGLISSIEYQRIPNLAVAPQISISSRREVKSVLILTRKDLKDVKIVALDRFSRSSVALLRILFHRRYGTRPFFLAMAPNAEHMLAKADAALIIGDAALKLKPHGYHTIDLATQWYLETGLPFVFAFWAIRDNAPQAAVARLLLAAKEYGLGQIPQRLPEIRARWDLADRDILNYFSTHIHFDLGPEEMQSLQIFYKYAQEAMLINEITPLRLAKVRE